MNQPQQRDTADGELDEARIEAIVARGPIGAVALGALSVGIVMGLWLAFYLLVFLPRGSVG